MHILDTLKERGYLAQITFEDDLYKQLEREPTVFYVGFDPTADSLHFGHYIPVLVMTHLQRAGHRPIALMGGGTAMVADPSGKTDLRPMLSQEQIEKNTDGIRKQMSRFLDFSPGKAILANNADWLLKLNYVEFLREIGAHFSVNRMLTAECYKQRMEKGLTFLEFNYMIMQSYDFLELFRKYNCRLQVGGDDQWSNILAGADLIRRKERQDAFAFTIKLLLNSDGEKMGKTAKGALWLDPSRVSPYEFYQYWRNLPDADVRTCLNLLTFLPLPEIDALCSGEGSAINEAKRVLAFETTALVHGRDAAEQAQSASAALFGGGMDAASVPTTELTANQIKEDNRVTTILPLCGLAASRGEARKLIQSGAVWIDQTKVEDIDARIDPDTIPADGLMLRKGKKYYCRLIIKQ
ncbi:MAG: tyrosine--tRNA ligase [Oscillospiraceae bacterium]|jgi:tyrosyl-tRNA synthetase|nr:tyrosine--tRNA ligase [Oscillospiraceae bacterium]